MGGKIACRAQGKSMLAALAGEQQCLLKTRFSQHSVIALRMRGKQPLDA